jgi:hypothetical protein
LSENARLCFITHVKTAKIADVLFETGMQVTDELGQA